MSDEPDTVGPLPDPTSDKKVELRVLFKSGNGMRFCIPKKEAFDALEDWVDTGHKPGELWYNTDLGYAINYADVSAMQICACTCPPKKGFWSWLFGRGW